MTFDSFSLAASMDEISARTRKALYARDQEISTLKAQVQGLENLLAAAKEAREEQKKTYCEEILRLHGAIAQRDRTIQSLQRLNGANHFPAAEAQNDLSPQQVGSTDPVVPPAQGLRYPVLSAAEASAQSASSAQSAVKHPLSPLAK